MSDIITGGGDGASNFSSFKIKAPSNSNMSLVKLTIEATTGGVSMESVPVSASADGTYLEGNYATNATGVTKIQVFNSGGNQIGGDCPVDTKGTDDLPDPLLDGTDTSAGFVWGTQ